MCLYGHVYYYYARGLIRLDAAIAIAAVFLSAVIFPALRDSEAIGSKWFVFSPVSDDGGCSQKVPAWAGWPPLVYSAASAWPVNE